MTPENRFGTNLKTLREAMGYSQQAMSDMLGVNLKNYGRWEQAGNFPSPLIAEHIAKFYGLTLTQMLTELISLEQAHPLVQHVGRLQAENEALKAEIMELNRTLKRWRDAHPDGRKREAKKK